MANSLGPELLAYFALAQVYALIMNDLFNVQTWEALIKFGAKRDDDYQLARTIKANLVIDVLSALLAFAVATLVVSEVGKWLEWDDTLIELALWYSFVIPFTLTTFTIGIPRLFSRFAVIAKLQFVMAILKLITVSLFSFLEYDARAFTAAYIATDILVSVALIGYSFLLLRRSGIVFWKKIEFHLDRDQIKFLWWTNLRTIVRIPVRHLDILIINQVMSLDSVGIYKAYKEIVGIIDRLGDPINQAIYPEYAKLLGKNEASDTISITKRVMKVLLSVSVVTFSVFLVASGIVIETLLGAEYLTYISAFYWLVALYCISLFLTPINSLFIAAGFAKYSFYIVLLNNILYLTVALVAGMYFGIYGVVLAFAVQMVFNQGAKIICLKNIATGWGSVIR